MDAEDDQDLPYCTEDSGSKPGKEGVKGVVGICQTVCKQCGNRTDNNDGQRDHDDGAQEGSADCLEGIRQRIFDFVFHPAENGNQYDWWNDGRCIGNRGQRNEQELERSSLADGRGDGCPGGVGQSQAAPQCTAIKTGRKVNGVQEIMS